jgi:membrane associated rhomboid family serine protease
MSSKPGSGAGAAAQRRGWTMQPDQAETVLAGARKAFFVMVGVLVVLWVIQIVNWVDHYNLTYNYGIKPQHVSSLPYILTAPFLHFSWAHIEGNSGPLFIFGFLAAYRGIAKFAGVTAVVVVTSGLAAWFFESPGSVGAGASGVVFGYFGYIMVRGIFDRHGIDVLVGAVMALCFAYQFSVLLPQQGIGWQTHIGGLAGGILSGWVFRDRRAVRAVRAASSSPVSVSSAAPGMGIAVRPAAAGGITAAAGPGSGAGAGGKGGPAGQGSAVSPAGGKGFKVDPANPRADLYKQLDDLGL